MTGTRLASLVNGIRLIRSGADYRARDLERAGLSPAEAACRGLKEELHEDTFDLFRPGTVTKIVKILFYSFAEPLAFLLCVYLAILLFGVICFWKG